MTQIKSKKISINKIKEFIATNLYLRLLLEFILSFILIGIISLGFAFGQMSEDKKGFFYYIYDINILNIAWITIFTLVAIIIFYFTGVATNSVNAIIGFNRTPSMKGIDLTLVLLFQFFGALVSSFTLYAIVNNYDESNATLNLLGGEMPVLKSFFTAHNDLISTWAPINFKEEYGLAVASIFSVFQGLLNASAIVLIYSISTFSDNRTDNLRMKMLNRFFIMLGISGFMSIFSANTANASRILAPAIVTSIFGTQDMLLTTIIYIVFQSLGLIAIFYEDGITKKFKKVKK